MRYAPVLYASLAVALIAAASPTTLEWAFPARGAAEAPPQPTHVNRLDGSAGSFTDAEFQDMARAIDWFPADHPAAPTAVLAGHGDAKACGFCHLAGGGGRPENAALRGLPIEYIEEQVHAFASGARRANDPAYAPSNYMAKVARAVAPADLHAAAAYFSAMEPTAHTQIIEAVDIPRATAWHFVYRFDPAAREPLGTRIVEGPTDPERFHLRDPRARYVAYVPMGAVARGAALVRTGGPGGQPCATCHTATLAGIAGASPTYIVRQLAGFRSRARNDPGAAPMQGVAARLTDAEIVDLAAYVGSRPPWKREEMSAALPKD